MPVFLFQIDEATKSNVLQKSVADIANLINEKIKRYRVFVGPITDGLVF